MSFKLNDYDAFLTSLFDKNNQQQKVKSEDTDKMQTNSPQFEQLEQANNEIHSQTIPMQHPHSTGYTTTQHQVAREEQMMRQHSLPGQAQGHIDEGPFPVDFDFGLPSFSYTTNTNRSKSLSFTMANHSEPHSQHQQPQQHHPLHQNGTNPGNVTEFMAEMGAHSNGNEPATNGDTFNHNLNELDRTGATPNNIFNLQNINTNPSSYNSDFGPIDEQSSSMMVGRESLSPISMDNVNTSPGINTDHGTSNILGIQNSDQLMRQATAISFQNIDDDTISPKMRQQPFPSNEVVKPTSKAPTKRPKKPRKAKSISGPTSGHVSGGDDSSSGLSPNMPYRSSGRPRVKSAHNVIEQRYRNKINDKFNALQNSVPTLRILAQKKERERLQMKRNNEKYDSSDDEEPIDESLLNDEDIDLEGLEPARKLNKATILANSIEYIKFLELKNEKMKNDHEVLLKKARMMGIIIDDDIDNE